MGIWRSFTMHKDFDLTLKNISKIEGHTNMEIRVKNSKVTSCKLKINENKRFLTQAVVGMRYNQVPMILSRICGTCGSAHVLCAIETIEKAFNVKVSKQTENLRNLLMNAGHLRDHAMHLYLFCLPDIFNKESVLDFDEKEHKWIHYGLEVKDTGNFLSTVIGGRAIHPPNAVIGGFTKFPTIQEIKKVETKLKKSRNKVLELIELLYKNRQIFKRKTNYVGLINKDYNFLKGEIKTSYGTVIKEEKFGEHLKRVVLPYANATAFEFESKEYFVGALARLNVNKDSLNPKTKKDTAKYLKIFPSDSILDNNLAQAIEMLQIIDNSLDILKKEIKTEKIKKITPKKSTGVGVVEAPRGTLYHKINFDEKGLITFADLCIPTQQNIFHMEHSIARFVETILDQPKKKISHEIEKMIRVYDPCMSCAAHFLRINWT